MGKLDEIWILSINSTVWRHINVKLWLDVGNDEYTLFWACVILVAVSWAVLRIWGEGEGGEKILSPVSPPR